MFAKTLKENTKNMKKLVLGSITAVAITLTSCGGSKTESAVNNDQYNQDSITMSKIGDLTSYGEGELYGYRDDKDSIYIKATYTQVDYRFNSNNQSVVSDAKKKFGVINKLGKVVIPCSFDYIEHRLGSTAYICKIGDVYGALGTKGDTIIPFTYDYLTFASTRSILCEDKNFKYGLLSLKNEVILPVTYNKISASLIKNRRFLTDKDNKSGYLDSLNNVAIKLEYSSADDFSEVGLAVVANSNGEYAVINTNNEILCQFGEYKKIERFSSNGFAAVTKDGERWGFINRQSKLVIPCKYILDLSFAYAEFAKVKNNKTDVESFKIDTLGNVVK